MIPGYLSTKERAIVSRLKSVIQFFKQRKKPWKRAVLFWTSTKKEYKTYYLVALSILILTMANQSIMQYALAKQRDDALVVNLAGRQRSLSQQLVNELYACQYHKCDYSDLKLTWNNLVSTHEALQKGNERLGLRPLNSEQIQAKFNQLQVVLDRIALHIGDLNNPQQINFDLLRADTDEFYLIMDGIVLDFQLKSEKDIRTIRLIELQLAAFSILIVLFEIFYIVIPILRHNEGQSDKLRQIAWHQSHAFSSHMKNIRDLEYVLKVEKNPERREEIYGFIQNELSALEGVSSHMNDALNSNDTTPEISLKILWNRIENLLEKMGLIQKEDLSHVEITHDDKVRSE